MHAVCSRRNILRWAGAGVAMAQRLLASDSDFWNRKPPSDWTPEEIERLLKNSPWAQEITPTYTSLPPSTDRRPWSENPPIGGVPGNPPLGGAPGRVSLKVPYRVTIRWESADPIRSAQKFSLPAAFREHYVLGIFFDEVRDLGSKPIEDLKQSVLLVGKRPVAAAIVQLHSRIKQGFLVGFPKTSTRGVRELGFSASVGRLALKAKFDTNDMLYQGRLAL